MTTYIGGEWLAAVFGYAVMVAVGAASCYLVRRAAPPDRSEMSYWKAVVLAVIGGWFGGTVLGPLIRAVLRTVSTSTVQDQQMLFGVIGAIAGTALASFLHISLYGPARRRRRADAIRYTFFTSAVASLGVSGLIFWALFVNGWEFLSQVVWQQVLGVTPWDASDGSFGIVSLLLASVLVLGIALTLAVLAGFGLARAVAGLRVSFYAPFTAAIRLLAAAPALALGFVLLHWLANSPTVGIPFTAFDWQVPEVMGDDASVGLRIGVAGIGLAVVLIPRLAWLSEQARQAAAAGAPPEQGADEQARPGVLATAREVLPSAVVPGVALVGGLVAVALLTNSWFFATGWSEVFGGSWNPRAGAYGVTTILMASLIVTGVAMVVATPLGLGSAVYLSEYARPGVRAFVKPILEVLAGVPSVVIGFFALQWIAPDVVGTVFGEEAGRGGSMMTAGLGVGLLVIPLVASVSEDAMAAVPDSLRSASAGLGARRITTTVRVVLPAAVSGIVAALILATARAIGETMVVYIAGGASDTTSYTADPLDSSLTMTAAMASLAVGTDNVRGAGLTVPSLYFVGITLFLFTLGLNVLGDRFVRRVREVY